MASRRSNADLSTDVADTTVDGRLFATRRERVFLVGLEGLPEFGDWPADVSLDELRRLVATAGGGTVGSTVLRLRHPTPATLIGSGQLSDLVAMGKAHEADTLVLDSDLQPRQQRNIENAWQGKVLDRTGVILDIFAARAHTAEGRLQVERAQLEYLMPRLSQLWVEFSRQRGGIGPFRGPGETQIETDRRLYRDHIARVDRQLDQVRRQRGARRQRRREAGLLTAALVGYTNSGKSTLLNALSGSAVRTEDKLFATLDPTTRRVQLPGQGEVLLTDTVGFIQRLPARLVQAFRATLEEVLEAQVLVHVVDLSALDVDRQVAVVEETLRDIGIGLRPVITALNKIDVAQATDLSAFPNPVAISALRGTGLDRLRERLGDLSTEAGVAVTVRIPYAAGELVSLFHRRGSVTHEAHESGGTRIEGRIPTELLPRYQDYRVETA